LQRGGGENSSKAKYVCRIKSSFQAFSVHEDGRLTVFDAQSQDVQLIFAVSLSVSCFLKGMKAGMRRLLCWTYGKRILNGQTFFK
jgi:hypothetical protein